MRRGNFIMNRDSAQCKVCGDFLHSKWYFLDGPTECEWVGAGLMRADGKTRIDSGHDPHKKRRNETKQLGQMFNEWRPQVQVTQTAQQMPTSTQAQQNGAVFHPALPLQQTTAQLGEPQHGSGATLLGHADREASEGCSPHQHSLYARNLLSFPAAERTRYRPRGRPDQESNWQRR